MTRRYLHVEEKLFFTVTLVALLNAAAVAVALQHMPIRSPIRHFFAHANYAHAQTVDTRLFLP